MAPPLPVSVLLPSLAISVGVTVLAVSFAVVCLALMLVVLAQKPKGGGLAGAFGGGGGSEGAFVGAKIGDVLTWITVAFFLAFILLAMGLTWAINPEPAELPDPIAGAGDPAAQVEELEEASDEIVEDEGLGEPAPLDAEDNAAASATVDLSTPVATPEESPIPGPDAGE